MKMKTGATRVETLWVIAIVLILAVTITATGWWFAKQVVQIIGSLDPST